ncbi:hypothetical protein [Variovorax sp. RCC_210]|uniref:hypothetical protein n=1 Tax=Variovorax sp. RCC_210 TaxID=3239217 RepID=UPI0035269660
MPADSTAQIGEKSLAGMGAPVPVNLSNGEYQLPPDQVHAIGVQALDQMKDATHVPTDSQPAGFKPELFFANGGVVNEEARWRPNSFGDTAAAASNPGMTQVRGFSAAPAAPTPGVDVSASIPAPLPMLSASLLPSPQAAQLAANSPSPPVAPGSGRGFAGAAATSPAPASGDGQGFGANLLPQHRSDGSGWRTQAVLRGTGEDVADQWKQGQYMRGAGTLVRGTLAAVPAAFADAGDDLMNLAQPAVNFGKGLLGSEVPAAAVPGGAPKPGSSAVKPGATSSVVPTTAPIPSAAAPVGSAAGFGPLSAGGIVTDLGGWSAPAADRLAQVNRDISFQKDKQTWRNPSDPTPGLTVIGNPGPAAAQSMFDGAAMRTAAARGSWSPRRGFQSDDGAIRAAALPVQAQQQTDIEAGRQAGETQRAQMGFQSAGQREAMRVAADTQRDTAGSAIARERLALDSTAAGFQTRAARQLENLQTAYASAKPEDRAAIAQQIREIQGKEKPESWKAVALPGSTDAMGNKTEGVLAAVNQRTGEMKKFDAQGGATSPIAQNPQALAIKNNANLSLEQKRAALQKLGYS